MLLQELQLVDDVGLETIAVILFNELVHCYSAERNKGARVWVLFQVSVIFDKNWHESYLESVDFLLDIVGNITEAFTVGSFEGAQLALESSLIQDLANAHTTARGLVAVARADTLTRSADLTATKTLLFEAINDRVKVKADMRTIRDKDPLGSIT